MDNQKQSIINWFGDRGIELSGRLKFMVIDTWVFILNNEYKEVELYALDSYCAEVYQDWPSKGFDWTVDKLKTLIPND